MYLYFILAISNSFGAFDALEKKTGNYITEGHVVGGDKSITAVKLSDIRFAKSAKVSERIVFDLKSIHGELTKVPYFMVRSSSGEGRIVTSLWSDVDYHFDATKIRRVFSRSHFIKRVNILPRVEEGLAVIEFVMAPTTSNKKVKVEAFYLQNPARIVLDIL